MLPSDERARQSIQGSRAPPPEMRSTNRVVTVVAILLSMFMAAMEATVVATAMPRVVSDLGGLEIYGWTGAAYMLASTVTMPLYGKLADLYGRRPIMLVGLALFLAGSTACGFARTIHQLIAFRALQGLGAGGLQPTAMTIVGDSFKPQERARIQGIFGAVWGIAGMIGPLLGGVIVDVLSWRWVFYINIPFGLLAGTLFVFAFHEKVEKKSHRLDFGGAVVLTLAIALVLMGASRVAPLVTLPLAGITLALFVLIERRVSEPLLPLGLLGRRIILVSSVAGALVGAVMVGAVTYLPLYVQGVLAGTPTEGGGAVAPMLVGWPVASAISGRLIPRTGYRPLVRIGFGVVLVASIIVTVLLHQGATPLALAAAMTLMGAGLGLANTALVIAVQESVPWHERGVATASTMFFRTIGGAISIGALGALLIAGLSGRVAPELLNQLVGPEHGRGIDPEVLSTLASDLHTGLSLIFDVIVALSVAAFAASLFFPYAVMKRDPTSQRQPVLGE